MNKLIRTSVKAFVRAEEGLTAVEYAILGGLIATGLATITAVYLPALQNKFGAILGLAPTP